MYVEKWKQVWLKVCFLHYYYGSFEVKQQQFSAFSFSWSHLSQEHSEKISR